MQFASDNQAGAAQEIIDAIAREASRFGVSYGESALDKAVRQRFSEIFEREVAVFFVATGSAANGLAMAAVNRPGGIAFCHRDSHMIEDECGGVEYLTGGARLHGLEGRLGKINPERLDQVIGAFDPTSVHGGQPMAVSITQQNEAGEIYEPREISTISSIAHKHRLPLHMDGARFANALVHLGVSPAEMTWKAGVDILSFGGTKNGCIGAEALVFFDLELARDAPFIRKRAGQLFSKSRFIAAQFDAYFNDGLWLRLARHANAMADRLREGIAGSSRIRQAWPTKGNEIFVVLSSSDAERLRKAGAMFHEWKPPAEGNALNMMDSDLLVRLVTAFSTQPKEIDSLLDALRG